jgi:glycosyltransferase involved in cell wall biosynthesis
MKLSVVIPTFNRGIQLGSVLDSILQSDVSELEDVEIIVIDDGSKEPAEEVVNSKTTATPFRLRYIYQTNAGPAEARNNGLRVASNDIVLFLDDDVLLFPDALRKHVEAHEARPNSVIFGPYPYRVPQKETSEYRYLKELVDHGIHCLSSDERFVRVETVASGNLSVRKSQFENGELYRAGLKIPVAEEYALIADLKQNCIPIYFVRDICGWHLQPPTLKDVCKQNYKYGLGISEVALKRPSVLELDQLRTQFEYLVGIKKTDNARLKLKKQIMNLSSKRPVRSGLRVLAESLGMIGVPDIVLFRLYRMTIGAHSTAGMRDGLKMFKEGT